MTAGSGEIPPIRAPHPRLQARFIAAFDGRSDPVDALFWLDHPREGGPSGATSPVVVLERMRAELYRREPEQSALTGYLELELTVASEHAAALRALAIAESGAARGGAGTPDPGSRVERRGPGPIAALIAVLLALGFAVTTIDVVAVPAPTALRFVGPVPSAATEEAAISAVFTPEFAALSGVTRRVILVPPPALAASAGPVVGETLRVVGTERIPLSRLVTRARRRLTVLVVCSAPGAYEWSLTETQKGEPATTTRVRQLDCDRDATATTIDLHPSGPAPTLRFTAPAGASTFVAIAVTSGA